MKKIFVSLLFISLFLSSCSIDWNDEKDKKIAELERQVEDLKKDKDSVKDNNDDLFEKNKECMNLENKAFSFLKEWDEINSIFYSKKLDSCLISFITYETAKLEDFERDYPVHVIRNIFTLEWLYRETNYPWWEEKIKELKWE